VNVKVQNVPAPTTTNPATTNPTTTNPTTTNPTTTNPATTNPITTSSTTSVISDFFFPSDKITTQPNSDTSLREVGIMHLTHAKGINAVRGIGTAISNLFGSRGFDTVIFDQSRTEALADISKKMEEGGIKKLCNLRMETDSSNPAMFVLNLYGTALK